jgi:hypothetical protein
MGVEEILLTVDLVKGINTPAGTLDFSGIPAGVFA